MTLLKSTAIVKLTVEVSNLGMWNDSCTAAQIMEQAKQEAVSKLGKSLHSNGQGFKIVGEPVVTVVQTESIR